MLPDAVEDHARNAHFVDPVEIDFEPIPGTVTEGEEVGPGGDA